MAVGRSQPGRSRSISSYALDALDEFISARVIKSGDPRDRAEPAPDEAQATTRTIGIARVIRIVIEQRKVPPEFIASIAGQILYVPLP